MRNSHDNKQQATKNPQSLVLCGFHGLLGMLLDFLVVPGPLPKYGRTTLPHKHFSDVKNKKVHKKVHTPKPLVLRRAVYH